MCNLSEGIYENGIEKGIEQGIEKGFEQGVEKGFEQGIEKVVINMLKNNKPIDDIKDATGLSIERINEIKETLI